MIIIVEMLSGFANKLASVENANFLRDSCERLSGEDRRDVSGKSRVSLAGP